MGLEEKVVFWGRRDDVGRLLDEMAVGVICSDSEGLSNAIMEYMAAGVSVVATDVGGNSELIVDGQSGFLVPPGDTEELARALSKLLDNHDLSKKMGLVAHDSVKNRFSVPKMFRDTVALYETLISAVPM